MKAGYIVIFGNLQRKQLVGCCGYNGLKIAEMSWDFQKGLASHPCEK